MSLPALPSIEPVTTTPAGWTGTFSVNAGDLVTTVTKPSQLGEHMALATDYASELLNACELSVRPTESHLGAFAAADLVLEAIDRAWR